MDGLSISISIQGLAKEEHDGPLFTISLSAPPPQQPRRRHSRPPHRAPPPPPEDGFIPALYPWAAPRRATVYSRSYLLSTGIKTVAGEVQCMNCDKKYEMEYDLQGKFAEVESFIEENKSSMHRMAPAAWMSPALPDCRFCGQKNAANPVIAEKKKSINWLFLLLGQTLGCCTLEQLRYFCKHTKNHRVGDKYRLVYRTYLGLCKQLDPRGSFDP
ncbi:uncharacterized protein LOC131160891 [Malania oleifera]|uniref:uncharacterized protein LOC131160891 n=1 Tax=Malania oleifera TaxID=397392 RepID=UPI0025ADA70F|nr:uncharacterized protein LOC131160891 [Malania oleifera]